jgi:hypothetical protein
MLYDYGTEIPRKPAEIPREVKFLAIAWEFRGNGNLNPAAEWILRTLPHIAHRCYRYSK